MNPFWDLQLFELLFKSVQIKTTGEMLYVLLGRPPPCLWASSRVSSVRTRPPRLPRGLVFYLPESSLCKRQLKSVKHQEPFEVKAEMKSQAHISLIDSFTDLVFLQQWFHYFIFAWAGPLNHITKTCVFLVQIDAKCVLEMRIIILLLS